MASTPEASAHAHREREAIAVCRYNMNWYQRHGLLAMGLYRGSQTLAMVLSAGAAILVLATELPKWVTALPRCGGLAGCRTQRNLLVAGRLGQMARYSTGATQRIG